MMVSIPVISVRQSASMGSLRVSCSYMTGTQDLGRNAHGLPPYAVAGDTERLLLESEKS